MSSELFALRYKRKALNTRLIISPMLLFVLLDFSKAFDKVNHPKFLLKLRQYGIRGHALSWIRAFLGNRSQTMVLGEFPTLINCTLRFKGCNGRQPQLESGQMPIFASSLK